MVVLICFAERGGMRSEGFTDLSEMRAFRKFVGKQAITALLPDEKLHQQRRESWIWQKGRGWKGKGNRALE